MFRAFLDNPLFALTALSLLSALVSAALQNATVDDQDLSLISYINPGDWFHDPLIGWEYQFNNGSRSYTWIPGASASLTFTGSGIYLQGPPAPDQAQRRVFLDGRDMGAFNLKGETREFCRVFFAATQLPYTTHTVVVAHNDTPAMIFAMDAWFVEFDTSQSILPFTTTTTTQTAATQTVTLLPTNSNGVPMNGTISGSPNTPDQNAAHPKSYSTIIIAIVVPVLSFLLLCIGGICIYRNRRTRSAHRRRESFREKLFRRGPIQLSSPLTPQFGKQAEGTAIGAAAGRDSDESRAMSPLSRYETALDHEYSSDQDHSRGRLSPTSPASPIPMIIPPANILDPRILSEAMGSRTSLVGPHSPNILNNISPNSKRPTPATLDPPAEWSTTLNSDVPLSHGQSSEAQSHAYNHNRADLPTASGTAAGGILAGGRVARSSPDHHRGLASNPRSVPSTVFSETESAYSLAAPPAHHYQQQDVHNSASMRDAEGDRERGYGANDFGSPPASPATANGNPAQSNSVLKRFSTAITSTLPFARVGSRPNSRHSNSHAMITTNTGTGGSNGNRDSIGAGPSARNSEDVENAGGRGYFRGMTHFNLGIPLDYRPAATANDPCSPSPTATTSPFSTGQVTSTRVGRHSHNPNEHTLNDASLGTRPADLGASSNGSRTAPPAPGTGLAQSPFDDCAFSSYTRQTRERVLSYPTAGADEVREDRATGRGVGAHPVPPVAPLPYLGGSEGGVSDIEPEDKDEKIVENLDGDTMRGEAEDEGRWSVGHGTLGSQGGASVGADGVTRTGSLGRQRSIRSTAEQGRGVNPPPYSVYIPPDTKTSPPPGSQ